MIVVYGDVIVDEYIYGESTRLSPEAPVPVVKYQRSETKIGGAGNVFNNIKSLTDCVELGSKISYGTMPRKLRVFSGNHYVTRIDYESDNAIWKNVRRDAEIYVVSDYNKGCLDTLDMKWMFGKRVIVDPKRSLDHFKYMWCVKPNRKEFEEFVGKWKSDEELKQRMQMTMSEYHIKHLIVTLGEEGVAYATDDEFYKIPSEAVEVSDVTGAGDTFTAVLAYALFMGQDMLSSIKLANKAAGVAVSHQGCYVISKADIGISRKKKVVFTNGCFDLLHQGHIEYLKQSKALGEELVVGINSDASVKRLKGEDRPINDQQTRKTILESLSFVDRVEIFEEDTPIELIKRIDPEIITKGGDYQECDVVGNGYAKVVILPYKDGVSTTKTIERIKKNAS